MKRRSSAKLFLIGGIAVLTLVCIPPGSRGDPDCQQMLFAHWINPGTADWVDASNWINDSMQHVVPTCESPAEISDGGGAVIHPSQTASSCELFLGRVGGSVPQVGQLTVNSGTLNTCKELHVGFGGTGKLAISNGGAITTALAADIAAEAGSTGAAEVDGTNSKWEVDGIGMYVGGTSSGAGGTGLLIVSNEGIVEVLGVPNTSGVVHVYPSGTLTGNSTISATNGTTIEGTIAPYGVEGTLTIGGDITFSGQAATLECNVRPYDDPTIPQVAVSGAADVGTLSRVSVTMTGDFSSAANHYILLHAADGLRGSFLTVSIKYPTDETWAPKITYDGNNVYLDRIYNSNP
jgi:T5SS/PEP-CTERM-associated repeat protein